MLIIVVAVEAEAKAVGAIDGAQVVVSGVGRTNAACATTETIISAWKRGGIDGVISAGVAGALPMPSLESRVHPLTPALSPRGQRGTADEALKIGDVIVASSCIYMEEGIVTARGFAGIESLGFPLGDFAGNAVPVDEQLLDRLGEKFRIGPIATVATCSGTDAAAAEVVRRTGALAEAMEGAAVVHAARRMKVPAIELRAMSNTCGHRASQIWDLQAAFAALGSAAREAAGVLRR